MITKTYKIDSLSGYSMSVDIVPAQLGGKVVRKRIAFTPLGVATVGCTYTSTNLQEQLAIEATGIFKRGEMYIYRTSGLDESASVEVKKVEEETGTLPCSAEYSGTVKEYVRVKSVQAACNVLVREYGADPDDVDDADKVIAYGKKVGASFPNMNY